MSQALYRKYRPKGWGEVIGQGQVVRTLKNAITKDRVGHAYLFSGPRGTGKTTLARILAKALNCLAEERAMRPCNECGPCKAVNEGRFLDLIEMDPASNTGVDDVRDLRDKIGFSPSQGLFKVYIIDEVHMLSTAAFNALLKTLEEPPAHAVFVLATTEIHMPPNQRSIISLWVTYNTADHVATSPDHLAPITTFADDGRNQPVSTADTPRLRNPSVTDFATCSSI